jgi:hypothetical protein
MAVLHMAAGYTFRVEGRLLHAIASLRATPHLQKDGPEYQ